MTPPTLPSDDQEFRRVFNAVNGEEMKKIILRQVEDVLERDGRLTHNVTFPLFAVAVQVKLVAQDEREEMDFATRYAQGRVEPGEIEIKIGEKWPAAVAMRVWTNSGLVDTPDAAREAAGLGVPVARRTGQGRTSQIVEEEVRAEGPGSSVADMLDRMQRDPHMRRMVQKLAEAHKSIPHRVVETSPLAAQQKQYVAEEVKVAPTREIPDHERQEESTWAQLEERRHRLIVEQAEVQSRAMAKARQQRHDFGVDSDVDPEAEASAEAIRKKYRELDDPEKLEQQEGTVVELRPRSRRRPSSRAKEETPEPEAPSITPEPKADDPSPAEAEKELLAKALEE